MQVNQSVTAGNLRATFLGVDFTTDNPNCYPNLFLQHTTPNAEKPLPFHVEFVDPESHRRGAVDERGLLVDAIAKALPAKYVFSDSDVAFTKERLKRASFMAANGYPSTNLTAQIRNGTSAVVFRMVYGAGLNVEAYRNSDNYEWARGVHLRDSVCGGVLFKGELFKFLIRHNHPAVCMGSYFKDENAFAAHLDEDFRKAFAFLGVGATFVFPERAFTSSKVD